MYNRTVARAQSLALAQRETGVRVYVLERLDSEWPEGFRQPTIVISTIPAHPIGEDQAHAINIPDQWLQSRTAGVFIEVSNPPGAKS